MPRIETLKRASNHKGLTVGQVHKYNSDYVMDATWGNDIPSRVCYIYDYFHDDQPDLCKGMTYTNTTKTKIDAKFLVVQYGSISKDQVEYHIMFRPNQKTIFSQEDELYYYQQNYVDKYNITPFIGLYIDIPDDTGVYNKWLICSKEIGNQFIKYSVLPCNYEFHWVSQKGNKRIKNKMWGVERRQLSYDAGLWREYNFESPNNIDKAMLPYNEITKSIYYIQEDGDKTNMRMIISILSENPTVWRVSKVETTKPLGILFLTFKQSQFNSETDYVNMTNGEMYADYWMHNIEPESPISPTSSDICELTASTESIKIGGSYKLITAKFTDINGTDVTQKYIDKITTNSWKCYIGQTEVTTDSFVTILPQTENNKIKVKLSNNKSYLGEVITIKCDVDSIIGQLKLQMCS